MVLTDVKGTFSIFISNLHASSSKSNVILVERKTNELFHIRVISKHTKIDTLVDGGPQVNIISEKVVKNLGLETKPHLRLYHFGLVFDNAKMKVMR